jgi:hypothetical protein
MAGWHLVQGNVIKGVLKRFKEAFPHHDWKSYVDELLAIEAAVEKHKRDPQYVFPRWFYSSWPVRFWLESKISLTLGFIGFVFNGKMTRYALSYGTK